MVHRFVTMSKWSKILFGLTIILVLHDSLAAIPQDILRGNQEIKIDNLQGTFPHPDRILRWVFQTIDGYVESSFVQAYANRYKLKEEKLWGAANDTAHGCLSVIRKKHYLPDNQAAREGIIEAIGDYIGLYINLGAKERQIWGFNSLSSLRNLMIKVDTEIKEEEMRRNRGTTSGTLVFPQAVRGNPAPIPNNSSPSLNLSLSIPGASNAGNTSTPSSSNVGPVRNNNRGNVGFRPYEPTQGAQGGRSAVPSGTGPSTNRDAGPSNTASTSQRNNPSRPSGAGPIRRTDRGSGRRN